MPKRAFFICCITKQIPRQWRGGPLAVGRVFWYLRTVELIGHYYVNPPRLDVRVARINPPRPRRGTNNVQEMPRI